MTIASQTSRINYTGDGSTTAFPVPFYFAANVDLVVILQDTLGNQTTQALGTNYNLVGATLAAGGTCTFIVAPPTGYLVTVYRDPAVTQTTSYNNNDPFPAKSHELALDKLTTIAQRTREIITRSIHQAEGDATMNTALASVAARKNKLLGFGANGELVYAVGPNFVSSTDIGAAVVDSRGTAAVTTFAVGVNAIITCGLATAGDGFGGTYIKGISSSYGAFQDGSGQYWALTTPAPTGGSGLTTPCGRITLTTGVAVMATSVAAQTTVYWTPYGGDIIPLFDGTNMVPTRFAEVSQATTDATKSPAAVAASKVYDLFAWLDGSTKRVTRGPAWTNSTTRGYTFTAQNGILLNTSTITNGPAALRGTWIGTMASNSGSTIDWIYPSSGSGGVAGAFNVWNAYNRVQVTGTLVDSGTSYTYTSATIRQARASAGNAVSFVSGGSEDGFTAVLNGAGSTVAAIGATFTLGIGYDSTTTIIGLGFQGFVFTALQLFFAGSSFAEIHGALGVHTFTINEKSDGTNANTINSGNNLVFSGRM